MKQTHELIPLFKKFINDTESGKRLKPNGEKVAKTTITFYYSVLKNLIQFDTQVKYDLRVCSILKLNQRELTSEKNYWKKLYKDFTDSMYKRGCFDNYVGTNIKVLKAFFKYVKNDKDIFIGDYYKLFYVRKEEKEVLVLSPEQLKFLIHDKEFEKKLVSTQLKLKDIFVFGCTTGLRFSDIFLLTSKNFEITNNEWYLKLRSQKTKTFTLLKLPQYAVDIVLKYQAKNSKTTLFGEKWLSNFNRSLQTIGEKAGFINEVHIYREKLGVAKNVPSKKNKTRFCDNMSSHMMRRTAITTHLILGMPEHLVKKISGHSGNSASFARYINHSQIYINNEAEKIHDKLSSY